MRTLYSVIPVLTLLAATGCAKSAQSNPGPAPSPAAARTAAAGPVRWTGNLTPTQQRSGGMGPRSQSRAFGSASLQALPGGSRTKAQITVSGSTQNVSLPWAVLPGQCGTGSLPLMNINSFPVIEIGSNGRGEISAELALELPAEGSFHLNVYWPGGQQVDEVMTCANLKRG